MPRRISRFLLTSKCIVVAFSPFFICCQSYRELVRRVAFLCVPFTTTEVGMQAQKFIDEGALVPDDTMVALISAELKKMADNSWLLDGKLASY